MTNMAGFSGFLKASSSSALTLVNSTTLGTAGTSISITGITTGYKQLQVFVECAGLASSGNFRVRLNGDSASNYIGRGFAIEGAPSAFNAGSTEIDVHGVAVTGALTDSFSFMLMLTNTPALQKSYFSTTIFRASVISVWVNGVWNNTTDEINRIDLISSQNMPIGTRLTIYGLK